MKKIIFSSVAIVTVAVVAGISSYAMWSDTETSEGNLIVADHLNLILDEGQSLPVNISNVSPGQSDEVFFTLKNDSNTVAGELWFDVPADSVLNGENGCVEPESNSDEGNDVTCDDPGIGQGELGGSLVFGVTLDVDGDETYETPTTLSGNSTTANTHANNPNFQIVDESGQPIVFEPGQVINAKLFWKVKDNNDWKLNDKYMTDDVAFDLKFTLKQ